ncbi:MAG: radical SAM protein [Lachnospiraceae bacterium]|nr:radical SAM protein [Lachnospiraceae bacterium]
MDPKEIKVEAPLTRYMFSKASGKRIPISGTFELSPVCNFSCRMCYVRKTPAEIEEHDRPMMTADRWLSIAAEARNAGMLYLLLTGGEPFLWPDFWSLYEELIRMGFLISINTNGSLIDEEAVERLKEMPPTRINITMYGADDDTYEALCRTKGVFSKVDRAITNLRKAGIIVKLNGSLTPDNVCDLEKCVRYASDRGLIYQTNTYMFPPLRRDPSMIGKNERLTPAEAAYYDIKSYRLQYGDDLYYRFLENIVHGFVPPLGLDESCIDPKDGKVRCRAGKAAFWITWDGWLTPCGMMTEPKVELSEKSFAQAWEELTEVTSELTTSGICANCPDHSLCHFCAAMAMAETGSTSGIPRYLCEMVLELKKLASLELTLRNQSRQKIKSS